MNLADYGTGGLISIVVGACAGLVYILVQVKKQIVNGN